jgi:hypothetical protein
VQGISCPLPPLLLVSPSVTRNPPRSLTPFVVSLNRVCPPVSDPIKDSHSLTVSSQDRAPTFLKLFVSEL